MSLTSTSSGIQQANPIHYGDALLGIPDESAVPSLPLFSILGATEHTDLERRRRKWTLEEGTGRLTVLTYVNPGNPTECFQISLTGISCNGVPIKSALPISYDRIRVEEKCLEYSRGGALYSTVRRAYLKDDPKKKPVALKIYKTRESTRPERPKRGAEYEVGPLLAGLKHKNLVTVLNVYCADGVFYVLMNYMNFGTLEFLVENNGPLSANKTAYILREVAQGLQYLHENGFLHRDLKHSHVLFDSEGGIKLCDYGVSKCVTNSKNVASTSGVGSLLTLSPERFEQPPRYGFPSDVWSYGLVLVYAATGLFALITEADLAENRDAVNFAMLPNVFRLEANLRQGIATIDFNLLRQIWTRRQGPHRLLPASLDIPDTLIDLAKKCIDVQPQKRLTCTEILNHPFLANCQMTQADLKAWFGKIGLKKQLADFREPFARIATNANAAVDV